MRIIIAGLMAGVSMASCNIRESKQTGGRYTETPAALIAKGRELAGRSGQVDCLPLQALKDMDEGDFKAWQAYLKATAPSAWR